MAFVLLHYHLFYFIELRFIWYSIARITSSQGAFSICSSLLQCCMSVVVNVVCWLQKLHFKCLQQKQNCNSKQPHSRASVISTFFSSAVIFFFLLIKLFVLFINICRQCSLNTRQRSGKV